MNITKRAMYPTLNLVRLGQFSFLPTGLTIDAAKAEIDASRVKLSAVKDWVAAVGKNNIPSILSAADAKEFLALYETVEKDAPAIDHIYDQVAGAFPMNLKYLDQPLADDITEWGVQIQRLDQLMAAGKTAVAKPSTPTSPAGAASLPGAPAGGIGTKEILIGSGAALGLGTLVYLLFKG